jgi:serine protease Do
VITLANGRAVAAPTDFATVVDQAKKAGRNSVLVGIYRNGRTAFLPLKISG